MTFKIKQEISEGGTNDKTHADKEVHTGTQDAHAKGKNRITITGMPVMF